MSVCPQCQSPVDTLRARHVRVLGIHVVAYCSEACKQAAAATAAEAAPGAQPTRQPTESGVGRSELVPPGPRVVTAQGLTSAARESQAPVSKLAPTGEPTPVVKAPVDAAPRNDSRRRTASARDRKAGRVASGTALPAATQSAAEPSHGASPALATSEVPLLRDASSPVAGSSRPAGRRLAWAGLAGAVAIAGGVAYTQLGAPREAATSQPIAVDSGAGLPANVVTSAPTMPEAATTKPSDPAAGLAAAQGILERHMASTTPRLSRLAAAAMARTGHAGARTLLTKLYATEQADVGRLEIAYALARANDAKGEEALLAALRSPQRDNKADAARLLALLGDKRAIPVLEGLMQLTQNRIAAAEQLALFQHVGGLAELRRIAQATEARPEERARAVIGLGKAGQPDVREALVKLATDPRFRLGAAAALAVLADERARVELEALLAVPSLRVTAAVYRRRLSSSVAPTLLPMLLADLESDKDTVQVSAAEALLLLLGDAAWAQRE